MLGIWGDDIPTCVDIHLVVFTTEVAVVVVGCMPLKEEQNGVAL